LRIAHLPFSVAPQQAPKISVVGHGVRAISCNRISGAPDMMNTRKSEDVVQQLLDAMKTLVTKYHPTVRQTGSTLSDLIPGTAFFPGGSGLWRGPVARGPMPALFPDSPVMFVGHNFDSIRAFDKAFLNGGEVNGEFWRRLSAILAGAGLSPESCFFTNALMGLKPGSATGSMPSVHGYREQCALFLRKQIEIVRPCAVVALGVKAESFVSKLKQPWMKSLHPTDWHFRERITRRQRLKAQGELIAEFLIS
jgi:uracil-DNA glycosylase family 4